MKRLILLSTAVLALVSLGSAQLVQEQSPEPMRSWSWKQTSDGSSILALNAWTLHEAYFAIPWGFDLSAGHEAWIGTRTRVDRITEAEGVFGYDVYALKDLGGKVGGLQFFFKAEAGLCIGPRTETQSALTGYLAMSVGARF